MLFSLLSMTGVGLIVVVSTIRSHLCRQIRSVYDEVCHLLQRSDVYYRVDEGCSSGLREMPVLNFILAQHVILSLHLHVTSVSSIDLLWFLIGTWALSHVSSCYVVSLLSSTRT